jgi:hypothetical protein
MDADGDFVVAWQSFGQDGSSYGVYGRRYDASGVAQSGEFRVNTFTTNRQSAPSAAMNADGDFVIVWDSAGQDGNSYGVYGQRYKAGGVPQGNEFRVNMFTANGQEYPSVAMDADGDFVVAWESFGQDGSGFGVYGQRYNASGAAQGNEFRVNTYTTNAQRLPSVALDAAGDFVVVWHSSDQDGSGLGVYGQRYSADGATQDNEFRVNVHTSNNQANSGLAVNPNGSFVVAWESSDQDSSFEGVYARRYPNLNKKAVYLPLLKKNGA